MKTFLKTMVIAATMTVALSTSTAYGAETVDYQPIYVNGGIMNDTAYNSVNRLKTVAMLEDGAQQVMDYVNETVLVIPPESGYVLDTERSAMETVLTDENSELSIKRHIFADENGSTEYMEAEQTEAAERPAATWQLQSWSEGSDYQIRALYHDLEDNSVLEVGLTFSEVPDEENINLVLDNIRSMTAEEREAFLKENPVMDLKKVQMVDIAEKQLIDYANGYTITFPQNMSVDASLGDLCTIIANDDCQIEIYRQPLDNTVTASTYKNYSNLFLQNTYDHKQQTRKQATIDGMRTQIITWMRPKLSRVVNDKPYYLAIDMVRDKTLAYTITIKSKQPLTEDSIYRQVLDSFTLTKPIGTVQPSSFINKNKVSPNQKPVNYAKWNDETKRLYDQYFAAESKLTWGIFEANAPRDFYTLKLLEKQVDQQFKFLIHYQHVGTTGILNDLTAVLNNAYREKRIVELTLQTTESSKYESNTIYSILNGEYDDFLNQYAKNIASFGHPVLFRLCNEMNGDWCQYSAFHTSKDTQMYRDMYRYIYDIFEAQGANKNTLWVWNPNERSFPDFSWNNAKMYYPGNDYVDIVGLTGYNTGNYYKGEVWRTFDEIYQPLYQEYVATYDKPFMITEFASNSVGGDKSEWIMDMFDSIHAMEKIKVAIWWSGCDWESDGVPARIYYMNESPQILATFKEMFAQERLLKK